MIRLSLVFATAILILLYPSCKVKQPAFETQVIDDKVQIGYGLGIGDVNGDGKQDILLADKKQFVWYRNPDWKRFVMIENLTERDNVCLAVRDINGDGQVEVAVGAQWNPGETSDDNKSGSVHYLIRPSDPTQSWEAVKLHHEPTVHRMRWVKVGDGFQLIVLPLHGRGNKGGEGAGVKVLAYQMPNDPRSKWKYSILDESMHLTHNMDIVPLQNGEALLLGGKEGAKLITNQEGNWNPSSGKELMISGNGFGEIRKSGDYIAGVQPLHGHMLALYLPNGTRKLLTDSLAQGHALAFGDFVGQGQDQIVVGWRNPNSQQEIGIKLFMGSDLDWTNWRSIWIDKNGMACEDLKVADLNGDGKKDIIAAGRSTHNLKIYWNKP